MYDSNYVLRTYIIDIVCGSASDQIVCSKPLLNALVVLQLHVHMSNSCSKKKLMH